MLSDEGDQCSVVGAFGYKEHIADLGERLQQVALQNASGEVFKTSEKDRGPSARCFELKVLVTRHRQAGIDLPIFDSSATIQLEVAVMARGRAHNSHVY